MNGHHSKRSRDTVLGRSRPGFWLLAGLMVTACGRRGTSGESGTEQPPAPTVVLPAAPVPTLSLQTNINMVPFFYHQPPSAACQKPLAPPQLSQLGTDLNVDGLLDEWQGVGDISDAMPVAGAGAAGALRLALVNANLALGVFAEKNLLENLTIEFGGMSLAEGQLRSEVRRLLRWHQGHVEEFRDQGWRVLGEGQDDGVRAAIGARGAEFLITRRWLGDVVSWPVWWLRLFISSDPGPEGLSGRALFFPSWLHHDHPNLIISGCEIWEGQHFPTSMLLIEDGQGAVEAMAAVFELARQALNGLADVFGETPLPWPTLNLITTQSVVARGQWDNEAFGDIVDGVGLTGGGYGASAPAARGLYLDLRRFMSPGTDAVPAASQVVSIADSLLDVSLLYAWPAAAEPLRFAWRRALLSSFVRQVFGMAYWLDNLPTAIEGIGTMGAKAGTLLDLHAKATAGEGRSAFMAMSNGFGHLLATEVEARVLLKAWRVAAQTLATRSNAADGQARALLAAVAQETRSPAVSEHLGNLWRGWLLPGPYAEVFKPEVLGDTDGDGVPDFIEAKQNTLSTAASTVGGGVTDLALAILRAENKTVSNPPMSLMADGDFTDWQVLMPKRLLENPQHSPTCPEFAVVRFFGALARHDALIVGAVTGGQAADWGRIRWSLSFDLGQAAPPVILETINGDRQLRWRAAATNQITKIVPKAARQAVQSFEVAVSRQDLGLSANLDAPDVVKLKLKTTAIEGGKEQLCTETEWFVPLVAQP